MPDDLQGSTNDQTSHLRRDDAEDYIVAAQAHLRRSAEANGESPWETPSARQEADLEEWAKSLGLLLSPELLENGIDRGGQEHDLIFQEDHVLKVTKSGYFGLTPGIDLALVSAGQDGRRFHLWEATPYQYLERLRLQNTITPGLNTFIGLIAQEGDLASVISQPRFEIIPVTQDEIDTWFLAQGFSHLTKSAYYRPEDNLAIFDAHDKNVVRSSTAPEILIPFDVIPVQPDGGFLKFIEDTLTLGDEFSVVRSSRTTSRSPSAK